MKFLGFTQATLARAIGVDQATISNLISGKIENSRHLPNIAKALGTNSDYLTGQTNDAGANAAPAPLATILNEQLDIVQINEIDVRMGMGGAGFMDGDMPMRQLAFPRSWVEQFTTSPPNMLFIAKGFGDSMQPTINDGDIVLIDTATNNPIMSDQIWAITLYGGGQIKRLRHYQDGFKIMSDNPNISDEIAMDGELHVIGRVVGIMRRV